MTSSARTIFSPFWAWVAAAIGICVYLFTFNQDWRPTLRENKVNFGIDLVGGTYIRLKVQTDKAVETALTDLSQQLVNKLEERESITPITRKVENEAILFTFDSVNAAQKAVEAIKGSNAQLVVAQDQQNVTVRLRDNIISRLKSEAVTGNIDVLRNRLDAIGVGEITIAQQGADSIIVELPNVDDPQQAKAMIGKTAQLEFKLVEAEGATEDQILDRYDGELPDHLEIMRDTKDRMYYAVERFAEVAGRDIQSANADTGGKTGTEPVVAFTFKPEGADRFYDLTRKNVGKKLAIIVDNTVLSAPNISTGIRESGVITGNFTVETAKELATMIKSGSFVAPVTFEEERQVGPSLGRESITRGLLACGLALALLAIFGIIIYKVAGFFAVLALAFNLLLMLAILSWLGATLSLPGIAGMVLTIGMAIDASILIYEGIKEDLAAGISPRKAVEKGFSDAMVVILDSNITTFLMGIVLYKFGTGPIQGFAVTMMVGIITTLLTGLFFLRSIFNYYLIDLGVQKLRI